MKKLFILILLLATATQAHAATRQINVMSRGAVCDGTTAGGGADDTIAINRTIQDAAAFGSGAEVLIPGTSRITGTIYVYPFVRLVGAEKKTCGLVTTNNIVMVEIISPGAPLATSVNIANLTLRAYGTTGTNIHGGTPIALSRFSDLIIDNGPSYAGDGIVLVNATTATSFEIIIENCSLNHFHSASATALRMNGSELWIKDNKFTSHITGGSCLVQFSSASWVRFHQNGMEGVNLFTEACNTLSVMDNWWSSPYGAALTAFSATRLKIIGNDFVNLADSATAPARGVVLSGTTTRALVVDNVFTGNSVDPLAAAIYETGTADYSRIGWNDFKGVNFTPTVLAANTTFLDNDDFPIWKTRVGFSDQTFNPQARVHIWDTDPVLILQKRYAGSRGVVGELWLRGGGDDPTHTNRVAKLQGFISTNSPGVDYVGARITTSVGGVETPTALFFPDTGALELGDQEPRTKLHLHATTPIATLSHTNTISKGQLFAGIVGEQSNTNRNAQMWAMVPGGATGTDYVGWRFLGSDAGTSTNLLDLFPESGASFFGTAAIITPSGSLTLAGDATVSGTLAAATLNLATLNTGTLTTTNGVIYKFAQDGPTAATIGAYNFALWASNAVAPTAATVWYKRDTTDGATYVDTLVPYPP